MGKRGSRGHSSPLQVTLQDLGYKEWESGTDGIPQTLDVKGLVKGGVHCDFAGGDLGGHIVQGLLDVVGELREVAAAGEANAAFRDAQLGGLAPLNAAVLQLVHHVDNAVAAVLEAGEDGHSGHLGLVGGEGSLLVGVHADEPNVLFGRCRRRQQRPR